jgi:hypothetical protein
VILAEGSRPRPSEVLIFTIGFDKDRRISARARGFDLRMTGFLHRRFVSNHGSRPRLSEVLILTYGYDEGPQISVQARGFYLRI